MKFTLSQIDANPFRRIDRYPFNEKKVAALRDSIRATSFWDNIVARVVDGRAQLAYGHHRMEALRREYSPDHEIDLIVRDLSDELMLKMMAAENGEDWSSSALIEHETVRAVVEAYASGRIDLGPPNGRKDQHRYAPSFIIGHLPAASQATRPYTAQTVANFLGWVEPSGDPQRKVGAALSALEFIEDGTLTEKDFAGLGSYQAIAVIEQARSARRVSEERAKNARAAAERQARAAETARQAADQAERERAAAAQRAVAAARARDNQARRVAEAQVDQAQREQAQRRKEADNAERAAERARAAEAAHRAEGQQAARVVGGDVSYGLRSGRVGYNTAWKAVRRDPDDKPAAEIDVYARRIAGQVHRLFDPDYHKLAKALDELIRFREHLSPAVALELSRDLTALAARVEQCRAKLASQHDDTPARDIDLGVFDGEFAPAAGPLKEITQ